MTHKRNELIQLLISTVEDDATLASTVRGFLGPSTCYEPPTFPVPHEHLSLKSSHGEARILYRWEELTTELHAFGDMVVCGHGKNQHLHRVLGTDDDGPILTSYHYANSVASCQETCDGHLPSLDKYGISGEDDRIRSLLDTSKDHLRDVLGQLPSFPVPQDHLIGKTRSGSVTLSWDMMTTGLKDLGFSFGDVVLDKTTGILHRVVAASETTLYFTSAEKADTLDSSREVKNFLLYDRR